MTRTSIALVDLGEQLPIALECLAKRLNTLQDTYLFTVETSIPSLGDPHESSQWYHCERLLEALQKHHHVANYDYVIGLTHVRITCVEPDPNDPERDYFSYGDFRKCAVISMNTNVLSHMSSATSKLQYAAFNVAEELLNARAQQNLCHARTERCLFDDCPDRNGISHSILNGNICVECRATLKGASVGELEIASIQKVLKWCKRRTGSGSLLARVARHPLTSLSVGTVVGWLSSVFITPKNCLNAVLAALLIPCAVVLFYSARDRQMHPGAEA